MLAERFFGAASEVKKTLQTRVAANALELARHGVPKTPFYLTGQVGGKPFSVHAEGERVIMTGAGQERREVELTAAREEADGSGAARANLSVRCGEQPRGRRVRRAAGARRLATR